jgi:hypothetical protein
MTSTVSTVNDSEDFIVATYFSLRVGLTLVALLLPIVLYSWGRSHGVSLQYSMSAYYHADASGLTCPGGHGVARDLLIGGLFIVAGLLYAYRGASTFENQILNAAALLAAGIALFPMPIPCDGLPSRFSPHGTFAILFFLCIAAVAVRAAPAKLERLHDPQLRTFLKQGYRVTGLVMVLAPGSVIGWSLLTGTYAEHTFAIEVAGIYAFAAYWVLKSWEIYKTNSHLEAAPAPPSAPVGARARKVAV